eukprot:55599_1
MTRNMLRFVWISLVLFAQCHGYHVLVNSPSATYGHWNQILHVSKGLLSYGNKSNFITFVIDESYDKYLNTIQDEAFESSSYQVLYTPIEPPVDAEKLLSLNVIQMVLAVQEVLYEQSSTPAPHIAMFLNHTQSPHGTCTEPRDDLHQLLNRNLTLQQNHITSLTLDQKVDVCLLDHMAFFAIALCDLYDIPTIINTFPTRPAFIEYSTISNTHLYYYNPFFLDAAPNLVNGTIMTYTQRCKTFAQNLAFKWLQRVVSYHQLIPMFDELNSMLDTLDIDASFDVNRYTNGWYSFWEKAAVISNLGPPFAKAVYHRPRVKQFGFILYPTSTKLPQSPLWQWINSNDTPILLISMGSKVLLSTAAMDSIYTQLVIHSNTNQYRVLWALSQIVYEHLNQTNEELETEYFKIEKWIPQSDILLHKNVKLFLSHAGAGGTMEGLNAKTLMILYPFGGGQSANTERLVDLECGLEIEDKEMLSDLTDHVDTLLVNQSSSHYYQNKLNRVHQMISANGNLSDAARFVEYAAEFGVKHLFCSYGAKYDCTKNVIPWYQQSMADIYLVALLIISLFVICTRKLCGCLSFSLYS